MLKILLAIALTVVATLIANHVWEKRLRDRLRISRVKRQDSREVAGLLELYGTLFPDEEANYSGDDILSILPDTLGRLRRKHTPCVDIILTAQLGKSVVAFVFCHYYPGSTHAIISYCGRDLGSEPARAQDGIGQLLDKLLRILRSESPPCTLLLFEVAENRLRTAFRQRAIGLGLQAKELLIDYRRPRYCLEAAAEGDSLHLLCVPLSGPSTSGVITRDTATSILDTLHLLGYGDYYDPADPRHHTYQEYLRRCVETYRSRMPDPVPVS